MHSDLAPELRAAIGSLEIAFGTAPVGVKGAKGIAERMVRTVVEGLRTLLENAGLPLVYWPYAMGCFCLLYNVTHTFPDGTTPWTRRHNREFGSPLIPFGCLVGFKSTVEETKSSPSSPHRLSLVSSLDMTFLPGGGGNEFVSSLPLMIFAELTSHALGLVLVLISITHVTSILTVMLILSSH